MAEIPLVAAPRVEFGSARTRRLRARGSIPGIVYGHGVAPIPVEVDARELRGALSTEAGANALFDLDIAGDHHLAIARELQRHPVRQSLSHVDFQVVLRDEIVPADVPVNLLGEALSVNRAGGTVEHLMLSIRVRAKPADIPVSLDIDISNLEIGDSLRVSDLHIPDEVAIDADPDTAIVVAHAPRALEVEAVPEGEVAGEGAVAAEAAASDVSTDASGAEN
jgi:large subunit ribosomal protein L25